jgi:arginyl-tRNA synthetase
VHKLCADRTARPTAASDLEDFGVIFDVWFSERSLFDTGLVARCVDLLRRPAISTSRTAPVVPVDRLRRREGPRRPARERPVHLLRFRHRLSPEQVRARLRPDHQHLGRRPPRLHSAREGRVWGARSRPTSSMWRWCSSPCSTATARRLRCPPAPASSSPCATLRDEVGNDACRFFYVLRKSDQHLDFDLDLAKSQTNENPVYYIQYAHARVCSVLASGTAISRSLAEADLEAPRQSPRAGLCRKLGAFPDVVENAARELRAAHDRLLPQGSGRRVPQLLQRRAHAGRRRPPEAMRASRSPRRSVR